MDEARISRIIDDGIRRYEQASPASHALWRRAMAVTPHGVANSLHFHDPYPLAIAAGRGAYATDQDGRRLLDLHLGHGVMVSGHADPRITDAIATQAARGTHTGALSEAVVEFMELITARFAADQVQLCASGAEATSLAIRIARAATGRRAILKVEGGYHGAHEAVMVSTLPDLAAAGADRDPLPVAWGAARADPDTHVIPFNDPDALERALAAHRPAALIIEPVLLNAGFIAPREGYLAAARAACDRAGAVMIADEVKTGVTIAHGGAMRHFGVVPDLLCLGKGMAGGVPVGAVAGRADLMIEVGEDRAPHYATFAGGPLAGAAGCVTLRDVLTPGVYDHMEHLGHHLADALADALAPLGAHPLHLGAKGTVIFGPIPSSYREFERGADLRLAYALWLHLLDAGIMIAPVEDELQWTVSVAHAQEDLAAIGDVARDFVARVLA